MPCHDTYADGRRWPEGRPSDRLLTERLNRATRLLCTTLTRLEADGTDAGIDPELAAWWAIKRDDRGRTGS